MYLPVVELSLNPFTSSGLPQIFLVITPPTFKPQLLPTKVGLLPGLNPSDRYSKSIVILKVLSLKSKSGIFRSSSPL